VGKKLFDQDGFVPQWVEGEQQWRGKLIERLENQQVLCGAHAGELKTLGEILEQQKIVSIAAQQGVAESNKHLSRLVDIHEKPGEQIHRATIEISETNHDVERMKAAALRACEMCRQVAAIECPQSASVVNGHCSEIERIIGEA
jgi:hypothetical protein